MSHLQYGNDRDSRLEKSLFRKPKTDYLTDGTMNAKTPHLLRQLLIFCPQGIVVRLAIRAAFSVWKKSGRDESVRDKQKSEKTWKKGCTSCARLVNFHNFTWDMLGPVELQRFHQIGCLHCRQSHCEIFHLVLKDFVSDLIQRYPEPPLATSQMSRLQCGAL